MTNEIRKAGNENNLAETEGHIDDILKGELEKYAMGNTEAAETAALGLATHRLERLITQRRAALRLGAVGRAASGKGRPKRKTATSTGRRRMYARLSFVAVGI